MSTIELPAQLRLAALILGLIVALASCGAALKAPGFPRRRDLGAYLATGLVFAVLVLGAIPIVPAGQKLTLTELGLALGTGFGVLAGWLPTDEPRARPASGAIALAILSVAAGQVPDPVILSYAASAFLLGWSIAVLPGALGHDPALGQDLVGLGTSGALVAGAIWGGRTLPHLGLGTAWALGVGAAVLVAWAAALWIQERWALVIAPLLAAALILPVGVWTLQLKPWLLWPIGAGLLAVLLFGGTLRLSEALKPGSPWAAMALILVGGGLLLLMNRLFGMLGVSLSAIALIPLLTGQVVVQRLAIALLSVFSGRAILQVFLDRSYLHQVGVDLTHPYTSFGLLAALFLPLALATVHARPEAPPPPRALEALILALFPLATAYFIHIDPYAAYIAGLLVMTLVAGVLPVSQDRAAKLPNLLPPMLLSGAPLGLLTAAWLLHEINAPRNQRLAFFVIAMLVVAAYWLGATVRRPKAPSQA